MWGSQIFTDSPGPYYKNDWHFIEVRVRMNSGLGVPDGTAQYWMDGQLMIDEHEVVYRMNEGDEDMLFNQLLIGPFIGADGSSIDQTMWVDDLTISTERLAP